MKRLKKLAIGIIVVLVAVVGGYIGLMTILMPETKLKVTVENRTDQPLTNGTSGMNPRALSPAERPLDRIPPHTVVTHMLTRPGRSDVTLLHYRVMGISDDTVGLGFSRAAGGVWWTFLVAEGDSLVVDSSLFSPDIAHGQPEEWSRRHPESRSQHRSRRNPGHR